MKNQELLTFQDLTFKSHSSVANGVHASLDLGKGFLISVVSMKDGEKSFGGLYGNASEGTYEVAIFHKNEMIPLATYDDVLGWQEEVSITRLMREAQVNGVSWVKLLKEISTAEREELCS
tara:strand:+ start:4322 stop:4681 length:360 start_codon:yes stop_codon:yes gene_type:complete